MHDTRRTVVLADDLTGAAEAADAFAREGFSTVLHLAANDGPAGGQASTEIVAIDGDLRALDDAAAAARVKQLLDDVDLDGTQLFVKIDSLLRGPLGPIAAAVSSALPEAVLLCCPALPAQGRTTWHGIQYLAGVPLADTNVWALEAGSPPATVAEAFAPLTGRTLDPDGRDDLRDTAPGTVWIADASSIEQLQDLVRVGLGLRRPAVFLGTLALAGALADGLTGRLTAQAIEERPDPIAGCGCAGRAGPLLAVVGSATPAAAGQAQALVDSGAQQVVLPAERLADGDVVGTDEILSRLSAGDVVVTVEGTQIAQNAQVIADSLAQAVSPGAHRAGVLALTGGHTARRVLDACGVTELVPCRPAHTPADAGVVTCSARLAGGPVPVITKAGSFGNAQTLVHAVRAVRSRGHVS